jgi:phosphate transport system substrate-binding protein
MSNRARFLSLTPFAAAASVLLVLAGSPARGEDIKLVETGSTLLYPLFNVWVSEYTRTHPGVQIETHSTGSGAGTAALVRTSPGLLV